jgi:hypothetical protein
MRVRSIDDCRLPRGPVRGRVEAPQRRHTLVPSADWRWPGRQYFSRVEQVFGLVKLAGPLLPSLEPNSDEIPYFIVNTVLHLASKPASTAQETDPGFERQRLLQLQTGA